MRKLTRTVIAVTFLLGTTGVALAQTTTQAVPAPQPSASPMSDAQIRQRLEAQGYTVESLKRERDYIEAKVKRGSQTAELRVDPKTGEIDRAEQEKDDDDSRG